MYGPREGNSKRQEEEETAGDLRLKLLLCFNGKQSTSLMFAEFGFLSFARLHQGVLFPFTFFIDQHLRQEYFIW